MNLDLGPHCLQYRLPKDISKQVEQTAKVMVNQPKVDIRVHIVSTKTHFFSSFERSVSWFRFFFPENAACISHLLHISICPPGSFYHGSRHYEPRSDCS